MDKDKIRKCAKCKKELEEKPKWKTICNFCYKQEKNDYSNFDFKEKD